MLSRRVSQLAIVVLLLLMFAMVVGVGQATETTGAVIQHPVDSGLRLIGTAVQYCGQGILSLVTRFSSVELPTTLGDPLGFMALFTAVTALLLLSKALRYLFGFALVGAWILFILRVAEVV